MRVVRRYGWWGAAYLEAVFRLADHAQSAAEQERRAKPATPTSVSTSLGRFPSRGVNTRPEPYPLPLIGLDGSNPLAFLAALGTLVVCDQLSKSAGPPAWLDGPVALSWGGRADIERRPPQSTHNGTQPAKNQAVYNQRSTIDHSPSPNTPVLHLPSGPPVPADFAAGLEARLARDVEGHASAWVVQMLERGCAKGAERDFRLIKQSALPPRPADRHRLDWVTALSCEAAIDADSQLQTVRCDYLIGNLRSLLAATRADHLRRALFEPWDYADGLSNQSLHWEPSEDRRHAYQWHQPNGDPTRKRRGGMLGANRLALEAWPLFPSVPDGADRVRTRGFQGNRAANTFWLWPLWAPPLTVDSVASMLALPGLGSENTDGARALRGRGVTTVFRSQRILVGKTPNLTPAVAVD